MSIQNTKKNKNFTLKNFIGREKFTEAIKKVKNPNEFLWYVAGPPGLVASIRNSQAPMEALGLEARQAVGQFTQIVGNYTNIARTSGEMSGLQK